MIDMMISCISAQQRFPSNGYAASGSRSVFSILASMSTTKVETVVFLSLVLDLFGMRCSLDPSRYQLTLSTSFHHSLATISSFDRVVCQGKSLLKLSSKVRTDITRRGRHQILMGSCPAHWAPSRVCVGFCIIRRRTRGNGILYY